MSGECSAGSRCGRAGRDCDIKCSKRRQNIATKPPKANFASQATRFIVVAAAMSVRRLSAMFEAAPAPAAAEPPPRRRPRPNASRRKSMQTRRRRLPLSRSKRLSAMFEANSSTMEPPAQTTVEAPPRQDLVHQYASAAGLHCRRASAAHAPTRRVHHHVHRRPALRTLFRAAVHRGGACRRKYRSPAPMAAATSPSAGERAASRKASKAASKPVNRKRPWSPTRSKRR